MNGEKTLRDRFPIVCNVCQQVILAGQRDDNGVLLSEDEPYRVIGMRPTYDKGDDRPIPMNVYAHTSCLGIERRAVASARLSHLIYVCQYCGDEVREGDTCQPCRERIARESKSSIATSAYEELIRNLAAMRDEAKIVPPETPNGATHSPRNGNTSQQVGQANAQRSDGLLDNPERLGVYEPRNEQGLVFMLGQVIGQLHYKMAYMDGSYPDCVMVSPGGRLVRAELEYRSSNFIMHRHDPALCDLVICWLNDRELTVPVLALHDYFDSATGGFDFASLKA